MAIQDKSLQCADCGITFTFTANEQEFYQSKGYTNEPKRCAACRQKRKTDRYGSAPSASSRSPRQMFAVKCAQCGKDTEVPFEPRGDKPVYCSDCYRKTKTSR